MTTTAPNSYETIDSQDWESLLIGERADLADGSWDHVYRLVARAATHDEIVVARLHDALEDGYATLDELRQHFSDEQVAAVLALTRNKDGETYQEYIDRLIASGSRLALRVKYLDLIDHVEPERFDGLTAGRVKRYTKALGKVLTALIEGG